MGVEEIAISDGRRDLFGGLRGFSVKPIEFRPFSHQEVRSILTASCAPIAWEDKIIAINAVGPEIVTRSRVSLRSVDPEGDRRDLVVRFWRWIRSLW